MLLVICWYALIILLICPYQFADMLLPKQRVVLLNRKPSSSDEDIIIHKPFNLNIMSILLNAIQRYNPSKPKAPRKWYPVQSSAKQLNESDVANLIANETTLNPSEALMAIRQLRKVVIRTLKNSQGVKLGDWGSFELRLNTEGVNTRAELTARNVKHVHAVFHPGKELQEKLG
ncbi:MAG: HU family DNA-binding protein [Prevotellaceae bacterium]|jgi:predicted histone-like DNA-binding protein|nr:HU family DNA-binding protein [Prevotellaceae bacterium]